MEENCSLPHCRCIKTIFPVHMISMRLCALCVYMKYAHVNTMLKCLIPPVDFLLFLRSLLLLFLLFNVRLCRRRRFLAPFLFTLTRPFRIDRLDALDAIFSTKTHKTNSQFCFFFPSNSKYEKKKHEKLIKR